MYLTIAEYAEKYGSFPDIQSFNRLSIRAESEIDLRTFGRISRSWSTFPETVQTKIKNAIAEIIFEMESEPVVQDERRVKSESVGSHSVTYEYAAETEPGIDYGRIINRHLVNTGLLYRGILYGN